MCYLDIIDLLSRGIPLNLSIMLLLSLVLHFYFDYKCLFVVKYLLASALFEWAGLFAGDWLGTNLFLIPLYSLVDYFIWTSLFRISQDGNKRNFSWLGLTLTIYVGIEIILILNNSSLQIIPSSSLASLCIIVTMMRFHLAKKTENSKLDWILFSFIFSYAAFNCFFGLFLDFLVHWDQDRKFVLWTSYCIFQHIFFILLPYYQWRNGRIRTQYSLG